MQKIPKLLKSTGKKYNQPLETYFVFEINNALLSTTLKVQILWYLGNVIWIKIEITAHINQFCISDLMIINFGQHALLIQMNLYLFLNYHVFLPIVIFSGYFAQYELLLAKSSRQIILQRVRSLGRNNGSQVRCNLFQNDN